MTNYAVEFFFFFFLFPQSFNADVQKQLPVTQTEGQDQMVNFQNHRLVFSILVPYFYDTSLILHLYYRSREFHYFIKMALTKSPRKRPTAEKLLQVQYYISARCDFNSNLSKLDWEAVLLGNWWLYSATLITIPFIAFAVLFPQKPLAKFCKHFDTCGVIQTPPPNKYQINAGQSLTVTYYQFNSLIYYSMLFLSVSIVWSHSVKFTPVASGC